MDSGLSEKVFIKKYSPSGMVRLAKVQKALEKSDPSLDLGCSIGILTGELSKKSKKVVGLEIRKDCIRIAKKVSPKNCFFVVGDATALPFKKSAFGQILSSEVIEHIKNYKDYLKEASRVSKKGAWFIVTTPNRVINFPSIGPIPSPSATWFIGKLTRNPLFLYPYGHFYGGFSPKLKKSLAAVGFETESIDFCGFALVKLMDDLAYMATVKKKTYDDVAWFSTPNTKYLGYYKKLIPIIRQLTKIDSLFLKLPIEGYIMLLKAKKK